MTTEDPIALAQTQLLELLSSRICHDLISPVGAIHNGIEFLEDMGPDALEDALNLMKHSTKQATVKLQTYRMAYGAGGRDSAVTFKDVCAGLQSYFGLEAKVALAWVDGQANTDQQPAGLCKLAAGALLLLGETLPKKGLIMGEIKGEGEIEFTAQGESCKFRDHTVDALNGEADISDLDPRLIHPYVLGLSARALGFKIAASENDGTVTLNIRRA
ncbi:MAG: histidine phosphotransferase family protein [Pseudobdellovibrionaceae bacterium]